MRSLVSVTQAEFNAFIASYPGLTTRGMDNGQIVYEDTTNGAVWPESLVASFTAPQPPKRPRPSGWRIPKTET